MYYSTSYINYDVFNNIENRIEELTQIIKMYNNDISHYEKNIWKINDWIYLEKVINIENGIENLKKYYAMPKNWTITRDWKTMSSFSYIDINRWIRNLDAMEKVLQEYNPVYSTEFYCGEEVSL